MNSSPKSPPDKGDNKALPDQPVTVIKGIAKAKARQLSGVGIHTLSDAIHYYPRTYENITLNPKLSDLTDKMSCSFVAAVATTPTKTGYGKKAWVKTVLTDDTAKIRAIWFHQPYVIENLKVGEYYRFTGVVQRDNRVFQIVNPHFEKVSVEESDTDSESQREIIFRPVYPLSQSVTRPLLETVISGALTLMDPVLEDPLPPEVLQIENLCDYRFALQKIHHPDSAEEAEIARRRLIYEELFLLDGRLRMLKSKFREQEKGIPILLTTESKQSLEHYIQNLPFQLTGDQHRVSLDVLQDMRRKSPMNRLIQGDVGSGKTAVAAICMMACALAGQQSVIMAPTSVLAQQHYRTLQQFAQGSSVRIALLTGSSTATEKTEIRAGLASGAISILVGTHAVLTPENRVFSPALLITDEQHRFGVRQRATFFSDGKSIPHLLVMSATPIPRSLGMILYGDMDISVIREKPPGRNPIETYVVASSSNPRVWEIIRNQARAGRQIYYVCPLIEKEDDPNDDLSESEDDRKSVTEMHRELSTSLPDLCIGLLHGEMKSAEKDKIMEDFLAGVIQVLVTTTVIEVGVDNPNASIMIVENAERFGLAQLHQLRGRIGRGPHRAVCILKSDHRGQRAKARLRCLCETEDGYAIAMKDLELRGPGDFFGTRQHGIPELRVADLYRDADLLPRVHAAWDRIQQMDRDLKDLRMRVITEAMNRRFPDSLFPPPL